MSISGADPMLQVSDLTLHYGHSQILHGVDIEARTGEVTCVMGTNGVGKTSLIRALAGRHSRSGGRVVLDGEALPVLPAHHLAHKGIALVSQGREIFPLLTVRENLETGLSILPKSERAVPEEMFELFPVLKEMQNRRGGDLSGGQQQQLAIARALINQPSILLADEPTGNLDSRTSVEVMGIFQKLNTERGITVLLITHEREIAEYGTRIITFRDGKIVSDKPNTVRRMAADEFAALPLDTDSDADSSVPAASTSVGALDLDLDLT